MGLQALFLRARFLHSSCSDTAESQDAASPSTALCLIEFDVSTPSRWTHPVSPTCHAAHRLFDSLCSSQVYLFRCRSLRESQRSVPEPSPPPDPTLLLGVVRRTVRARISLLEGLRLPAGGHCPVAVSLGLLCRVGGASPPLFREADGTLLARDTAELVWHSSVKRHQ